ncbi:ABC transporter permease [Lactovum miscens]|uniref:Oligopeptide transport system permease protein n=1 Tax=Lactovum miscens TaxID=190387 RepID=A0A841C0N0_9LACT|nr:ABC transporter permease [Lactovum miscens]MBB5887456.1 oligopeptide transport system permease protein [Lactovum miscens]
MRFSKYILKRLGWLILTLFIIMTITFFLMQVMPGSPFNNPKLGPDQVAQLLHTYGLDKPLIQQYFIYLKNFFTGDFGTSFSQKNQPVAAMILQRLPVSAELGLQAMLIGLVIGIPMGVGSARHRNGFLDGFLGFISTLLISVPSFVMAMFLLFIFGYSTNLLPIIGWDGMFSATSWMPAIALSFGVIGTVVRFVRAEMVESLNSDYIQLARAKGLSDNEVVYGHALRNSLIPVLTLIGPMFAGLLTGSMLIENIFSIPGIGQQFVTAISAKDFPVIMATTIIYAIMLMGFILIFDIIIAIVDPRVRLD